MVTNKHFFETEQFLPIDLKEAWDFFANPSSLKVITPKKMQLRFLEKLQCNKVYDGMVLSYMIKPFLNFSVYWKSKMENVVPFKSFTDIQINGPYSFWEHKHTFEEANKGIKVIDQVEYALPFGFLGNVFHSVFIKNKVSKLFQLRQQKLDLLFPSKH